MTKFSPCSSCEMNILFNFVIKIIWFLINNFEECYHKWLKWIGAIDIFFARNVTHEWYICLGKIFQLFYYWAWILHILFEFNYIKCFPLINYFFVKCWPARGISNRGFWLVSFFLNRETHHIIILHLNRSFLSSEIYLWLCIVLSTWNTYIESLVLNSMKIYFGFLWKHIGSWFFRK